MNYELYSWQASDGTWNFCVLPSPSGVNLSAAQVFNKKFLLSDVKELKRKISSLRSGATIFWSDRLGSSKKATNESAKLGYPPLEMVQEIQHWAEARKIKIEMLSSHQKQE